MIKPTLKRLKQTFEDRERQIANDIARHVRVRVVVTCGLSLTVIMTVMGHQDYALIMSTTTNLLWIWD